MLVVFWVCQVNCVMQHNSVLVREQLGDTVHLTSPTYLPNLHADVYQERTEAAYQIFH